MDDAIEVLIEDLGLGHLRRESLAALYRNGVNLGKPHYPDNSTRIEFEVGTKDDHNHCMDVLDAVVGPFQHSRSCGLARVVRLASQEELVTFTRRLSLALFVGWHADSLGRRAGSVFGGRHPE